MANNPKTPAVSTPAEIDRAQRAADLAVQGLRYREIAERVGYKDESGARKAVTRHFQRRANASFEEMRPMMVERSELLFRSAMQMLARVTNADPFDLQDWERAHKRAESMLGTCLRASGLDRGPKITVNQVNAVGVDFAERAAKLLNVINGELEMPVLGAIPTGDDDGDLGKVSGFTG